MPNLEELKKKRDQLTARIQQAEARKSQEDRKAEAKIKILVGSAILDRYKKKGETESLLKLLDTFLTRPSDRKTVLGDDGFGSEVFRKLTEQKDQPGYDQVQEVESRPQYQ